MGVSDLRHAVLPGTRWSFQRRLGGSCSCTVQEAWDSATYQVLGNLCICVRKFLFQIYLFIKIISLVCNGIF